MEISMALEKGNSSGSAKKKQPHKRRGKSFWIKAVSDFEGGALSMQDFCAERGLAVSTFHAWRRRLSAAKETSQKVVKEAFKPSPKFLPVYVASPETSLDKPKQPDVLLGSQPLSRKCTENSLDCLSKSSSGLTLCLNGNLKISIDKDFHGATLQRLMNHLASQGLAAC
jgi:hypothetical protein